MTQSAFSDTVFTPRSTHRLTTDRYRAPAGARPTHKTHRRRDELLLQKYVPFNPFHAYISGSFLKPSQPVHSQSLKVFISTPEAGSTIRFIDYSERIWLFAPCPSVCLVSLLTRKPTSRRAPDLLCSAHRCNLQIAPTTHKHTDDMQSVCLLPDLHFLPLLRRVLTADDSTHIQQQHAYLERLAMARKRGSPPAPFAQVDRASARRAPLRQAHRLYIARDGPSAACPSYPCRL